MKLHETAPPPARPRSAGRATALYLGGLITVAAVVILTVLLVVHRKTAVSAEALVRHRAAAAGVPVIAVAVHALPVGRTVTLAGDVKPWKQATLYAKVSAYVKQISVDKGDRVKFGQLLATLESPETDQQILSARADLATKKLVAARYRQLAPKGVVSQQELDQALGNLAVAQAELARVEALGSYESIRAPFDAIVTARFVDVGALLPAATGAQPILEVTDMSRVRVYVYLGQGDAPFVRLDAPVTLESDAHPGEKITASVARITRELDARTRTMLIEVDVDNPGGWIYPGLFVRATVKLDTPGGLAVPAEAVVLREGRPTVAVIEGGRAHFVTIEAGEDDGRTVRVLSGLREGQLVALHVGDEVSDGAVVQAVTQPSAQASAPANAPNHK